MSKYTTQLRFICESLANNTNSENLKSINDIVKISAEKIFDFEYPIFDEKYKPILQEKIVRHYYLREIGQETYGLFKFFLENTMNEIMPYFNKLYESELLKFNPFYDVDLTTERTGNKNTDSNKNSTNETNEKQKTSNNGTSDVSTQNDTTFNKNENSNSDNWDLYSNTPQNGLNMIGLTKNLNYLDNAREISNTSEIKENNTTNETGNKKENYETITNDEKNKTNKNTENGNINSITKYLEHVSGKKNSKSNSELLIEFRKTFLNIDVMVIKELEDLFLQLW